MDAHYVQILDKRLKTIGTDVPGWRVLMSLYDDTYLSISEIADYSNMRLNTTTKVVQRMIAAGLVTTRLRPTDARVTEACLTQEGDRIRGLALTEARAIFDTSFQNISDEEMAMLNTILEKVFDQLKRLP